LPKLIYKIDPSDFQKWRENSTSGSVLAGYPNPNARPLEDNLASSKVRRKMATFAPYQPQSDKQSDFAQFF
jgi:hypothetical protein